MSRRTRAGPMSAASFCQGDMPGRIASGREERRGDGRGGPESHVRTDRRLRPMSAGWARATWSAIWPRDVRNASRSLGPMRVQERGVAASGQLESADVVIRPTKCATVLTGLMSDLHARLSHSREGAMAEQQSFELKTWGGRRHGAGRKPSNPRGAIPHARREEVRAYHPVHVTLRVAEPVWNLRSERSYRIIDAALRAARRHRGFRIVHFSIQGNHLHLIVEADGTRAFALGVRALSIRLARRLNAMMGRSGPVFADRYHAHVLRTPTEVRNAVRYVLGNFESHAARRGERTSGRWVDPFSSAARKPPREAQGALFLEPVTAAPETWLLR